MIKVTEAPIFLSTKSKEDLLWYINSGDLVPTEGELKEKKLLINSLLHSAIKQKWDDELVETLYNISSLLSIATPYDNNIEELMRSLNLLIDMLQKCYTNK